MLRSDQWRHREEEITVSVPLSHCIVFFSSVFSEHFESKSNNFDGNRTIQRIESGVFFRCQLVRNSLG